MFVLWIFLHHGLYFFSWFIKPGFGWMEGRAVFTALKASSNDIFSWDMRKPMTTEAERDTPALQWTSTTPSWRTCRTKVIERHTYRSLFFIYTYLLAGFLYELKTFREVWGDVCLWNIHHGNSLISEEIRKHVLNPIWHIQHMSHLKHNQPTAIYNIVSW